MRVFQIFSSVSIQLVRSHVSDAVGVVTIMKHVPMMVSAKYELGLPLLVAVDRADEVVAVLRVWVGDDAPAGKYAQFFVDLYRVLFVGLKGVHTVDTGFHIVNYT